MKLKKTLLLLILAVVFVPSWAWLTDWQYRKEITITEQSGNDLTDYQVLLTVDTVTLISEGKMNSDCSDIRFTDETGNLLNYWIENGCNSANTKIWVKVSSIPASGSTTIYMYYGNPSATSESNPKNVFVWYDDFSNFDPTDYVWDPDVSYSVSEGIVTVTSNNGFSRYVDINLQNYYLIEVRAKVTEYDTYSGVFGSPMSSSATGGANSNADATILYMTSGWDLKYYAGDGSATTYNLGNVDLGVDLTSGVWHNFGVWVTPNAFHVYFDGSKLKSRTGITWHKEMHYARLGYFQNYDSNGNYMATTSYDWIRIRRYVEPEPAYIFGSEETATSLSIQINNPTNNQILTSDSFTLSYTVQAPSSTTQAHTTVKLDDTQIFDGDVNTNQEITLDIIDLTEGSHTIEITATDDNNNQAQQSVSFKVDVNPPTCSINVAPNDATNPWYNTKNLNLVINCQDAGTSITESQAGYYITTATACTEDSFNDPNFTPVNLGTAFNFQKDGIYMICVKVKDEAGHEKIYSFVPYRIDTHPPLPPSTSIPEQNQGFDDYHIPIKITYNDDVSEISYLFVSGLKSTRIIINNEDGFHSMYYDYNIYGETYTLDKTITLTYYFEGTNTLSVQVCDVAGNCETYNNVRTFYIDTHPPNLQYLEPTETNYLDYPVSVNYKIRVSDAHLTKVEIFCDANTQTEPSETKSYDGGFHDSEEILYTCIYQNVGKYTFKAKAYDSLGHTSEITKEIVVGDNTPTINIVSAPTEINGSKYQLVFKYGWYGVDNVSTTLHVHVDVAGNSYNFDVPNVALNEEYIFNKTFEIPAPSTVIPEPPQTDNGMFYYEKSWHIEITNDYNSNSASESGNFKQNLFRVVKRLNLSKSSAVPTYTNHINQTVSADVFVGYGEYILINEETNKTVCYYNSSTSYNYTCVYDPAYEGLHTLYEKFIFHYGTLGMINDEKYYVVADKNPPYLEYKLSVPTGIYDKVPPVSLQLTATDSVSPNIYCNITIGTALYQYQFLNGETKNIDLDTGVTSLDFYAECEDDAHNVYKMNGTGTISIQQVWLVDERTGKPWNNPDAFNVYVSITNSTNAVKIANVELLTEVGNAEHSYNTEYCFKTVSFDEPYLLSNLVADSIETWDSRLKLIITLENDTVITKTFEIPKGLGKEGYSAKFYEYLPAKQIQFCLTIPGLESTETGNVLHYKIYGIKKKPIFYVIADRPQIVEIKEYIPTSEQTISISKYLFTDLKMNNISFCMDNLNTTFAQQIAYSSSTNTPVFVMNAQTGCYVVAGRTGFMSDLGKSITFYTAPFTYYIYSLSNGNSVFLGNLKGDIPSKINMDALLSEINSIKPIYFTDLGYKLLDATTIVLNYYTTNSANLKQTVIRIYHNGLKLLEMTETNNPSNVNVVFDYSSVLCPDFVKTGNFDEDYQKALVECLGNSTKFDVEIVERYTDYAKIKHYTIDISDRKIKLPKEVAVPLALLLNIFAMTMTASSVSMSWGGLAFATISLFILGLSDLSWQVKLASAVLVIGMMYLILSKRKVQEVLGFGR